MVAVLDEKKGEDILVLDIAEICSFTDYFVLCSGGTPRTLDALSEEVGKRIKKQFKARARLVEGESKSGWVLMDYGDIILNLFLPSTRIYYQLEELWRDGQVVVHLQ